MVVCNSPDKMLVGKGPNLGKGWEKHQTLGSAAALGCRGSCSANQPGQDKGVAISPHSNVDSLLCISKPPCLPTDYFNIQIRQGGSVSSQSEKASKNSEGLCGKFRVPENHRQV